MYSAPFEYLSPTSLEEALKFMNEHEDECRVLAGGHSLIPLMKLRAIRPKYVVDLGRIKGLSYIKQEGNIVSVGAATTYREIQNSQLLLSKLPLLPSCVSVVGDVQVRNWGTVGGSLSHCDPAGDFGSAVIASRAQMVARSVSGERIIESDQWFVDSFQSALKPNEILTEIRFPLPHGRSSGVYLKLERKSGDYATVGVAAQIAVDSDLKVLYAGIGLTAVAPTNMRARSAEQSLKGAKLTDENIEAAARAAAEECRPTDDPLRGSASYKKAMVRVFVRRALKEVAAHV
ncbi:MAG: xanthine dehydrogenase family protein subunit M [Thermoprotei archaeon]